MMESHNFQTESFLKMLRSGWSNAYFRICLNSELEMRRSMLHAFREDVKTWKYMLRQEDLVPGNEAAVANRLLDPSNKDGFDVNNVFPAGGVAQLLRMFLRSSLQTTSTSASADDPGCGWYSSRLNWTISWRSDIVGYLLTGKLTAFVMYFSFANDARSHRT